MTRRRLTAATVAAVAGLAIAGCGSSGNSNNSSGGSTGAGSSGGSGGGQASDSPYNIIYQADYSGITAPYTTQERIGIESAVSVINAEGGADGHKLVLGKADDAGSPSQAVTAAHGVVASNPPDAVIPGSLSTTTIPVLPIYQRAGVLMMSISEAPQANDPKTYPLSFGVNPSINEVMAGMAQHLNSIGAKKVAVLTTNSSTGVLGLQLLQADLKKLGGTVVASQALNPAATSATAALAKLKSSNPQVLVVEGFSGGLSLTGTLFKNREQLGWNIPTITDDDTTASPLFQLAGGQAALKNVTFQAASFEPAGSAAQKTPGFKKFITELNKLEPKRQAPIEVYAASWNLAVMIAAGVEAAKSTDPTKVAAAIQNLKVNQVPLWFATKQLGYSSSNHYVVYSPSDFLYVPAANRTADGSIQTGG